MVEQGTENPRVGGSTPSLATILPLLVAAVAAPAAGCGQDPCETLCTTMGRELGRCMGEWPADWQDLDATGRRAWVTSCRNGWSEVRADLEPRELDDALDQCGETQDALDELDARGETCDVLRALYLAR